MHTENIENQEEKSASSAEDYNYRDFWPKRGVSLIRWMGYPVILIGLLLIVALLAFRYYGLPDQISERIRTELDERGLHLAFDKVYLDPFGGVVAKEVSLVQKENEKERTLTIGRIRFAPKWISWWRGGNFLESASIRQARLDYPLTQDATVSLEIAKMDVVLQGDRLQVRSLIGSILNLRVQLQGVIDLHGLQGSDPGAEALSAEQTAAMWKQFEAFAEGFGDGKGPLLDVHFDLIAGAPESSTVLASFTGNNQQWKGVVLDKLDLQLTYKGGRCQLDGNLDFLRGGVHLEGTWQTQTKKARVFFSSNSDLALLATAFPSNVADVLEVMRFRSLPTNQAELELNWEDGFSYRVLGRLLWRDFSVYDSYIDEMYLSVSYDGQRLMVPEFYISDEDGQVNVELFYDGAETLQGKVTSTLDPTRIRTIFGEGAQAFFESLQFNFGPTIEATVTGTGLEMEKIKIAGNIYASEFVYKGVAVKELKSGFEFHNGELFLPDLLLVRKEGKGSGSIRHNFRTKQVEIRGVKTTLNVQQTALIIGDKLASYVRPYMFAAAPYLAIHGKVDLDKERDTNLKVEIRTKAGLEYKFLGEVVRFRDVNATMQVIGKKLTVRMNKPATLFEGNFEGVITVQMTTDPTYEADIKMNENNFGQLMTKYFENDKVVGTMSGTALLKGKIDDMASITGWGRLSVVDGNLYPIPVFGGLSEILNSIIPNLGYTDASRADASFEFEGGKVTIDKVDIYSTAFALIGNGVYDYVNDDVDMNMRLNIRGIMGVPLYLVSKLFEYRGQGSLKDTKWEPKIL